MKNLKEIYKILLKEYGTQGWWPINNKYKNRNKLEEEEKFEVSVGAILTQNISWNNANKALNELRKNNLLNKEELNNIETNKLALLIKSSGYNNQKAKKIKSLIEFLNKKDEINRKNLLEIWGIGKETADSILLYAYNNPIFVIDAYTKRIFSRIGICKENIKYDELQEIFHKNLKLDNKIFNEYHALIVEHAKRYCKKNPECEKCPLKNNCSYYSERLIK